MDLAQCVELLNGGRVVISVMWDLGFMGGDGSGLVCALRIVWSICSFIHLFSLTSHIEALEARPLPYWLGRIR